MILQVKDPVVYLSLGGNIGDRLVNLQRALESIVALPATKEFEVSFFYETSPVSDIPQSDYLNVVCRFKTNVDAKQLLLSLQLIEKTLGKSEEKYHKLKNLPRIIDIDILFFGNEFHQIQDLEIPHPRWRERLFVIIPLLDLTKTIAIPNEGHVEEIVDLLKLKDSFVNKETQWVSKIDRVPNRLNFRKI